MAPRLLFQKALDYNARKVTSKFRIPFGRKIYERRWLHEERLDINRMTLPHATLGGRGIRLVQISDLHLGLYVGDAQLSWLARRIEGLRPDLLIITGDFVNTAADEAYPAFEGLRALASLAPTYGVLGNHDFWHGPDELAAFLASTGITLLRNEHRVLEVAGNRLLLAGVDDWKTGHDDLPRAVANMTTEPMFRLLLSHCPDLLHPAAEHDFQLVLAGHTHGAQVRVPLIGGAVTRMMHNTFDRGWSRSGDTALYINRGLGAVFLPVRYRSHAEVTVLHLAPAAARPLQETGDLEPAAIAV